MTTAPNVEAISWGKLLESRPPGNQELKVNDAIGIVGGLPQIRIPSIQLFCSSESCGGIRYFDGQVSERVCETDSIKYIFLWYTCRHCKGQFTTYAVRVHYTKASECYCTKLGQLPQFGPHIPTKMFSLLGEDQELFMKGRRAESQGMGVGAFAYYRRVVENQKNRLIDEIIKVSKRIEASPDLISKLEAARQETQFHKAVDIIKDGIPDVLKIDGHNPLILLHTALSDGLHIQTDEECLIRATSIRVVMAELAERITQVLGAHDELKSAVSQLLQISSTAKQKPAKSNPPEPPK